MPKTVSVIIYIYTLRLSTVWAEQPIDREFAPGPG